MSKRELQLVRGLDIAGYQNLSESAKVFAFLSIFHPEIPLKQRLIIANKYLLKK